MKPVEKKHPANKLEFLEMKWAVVKKLYDYLYGSKFEAVTDNNSLTNIFTTAELDTTGQRWIPSLLITTSALSTREAETMQTLTAYRAKRIRNQRK